MAGARSAALGMLLLAVVSCAPPAAPAAERSAGVAPPPAAAGTTAASAAPPAGAPTAPARVALKTAYTTATASFAPLWVASERGLFAEQGIDAEVTFISAGQAVLGAVASGEAPLVLAGANQVLDANLSGGAYVILGSIMPYLSNAVYVHPSIQRPDELRGKSLGVSNFGAISHVAMRVALDYWGLVEGRDVQVVRSGGTPETLAAMQSGAIAGGSFSPPQTFQADDLGFRELLDVAALRYDIGSTAVISTRRYVADQPAITERYLRALVRATQMFLDDRDAAVDAIVALSRVDDRRLAERTWEWFRDKMTTDIAISPRAIENNLKLIAEQRPEALQASMDQFVDNRFAERLHAER